MTVKRGKTPKCKHCGEWVDKSLNEFTKNSKGYYHNQCHEVIAIERKFYEELTEYVSSIYKIEYPTGWMLKQIKEYKEKRGYTYKGMELTLRFMYEVENKYAKEASESGLGLIPYYYEKAKVYYASLQSVHKSIETAIINNQSEIIYMKPIKHKSRKKTINIENL